jgi:hypothetical protein
LFTKPPPARRETRYIARLALAGPGLFQASEVKVRGEYESAEAGLASIDESFLQDKQNWRAKRDTSHELFAALYRGIGNHAVHGNGFTPASLLRIQQDMENRSWRWADPSGRTALMKY